MLEGVFSRAAEVFPGLPDVLAEVLSGAIQRLISDIHFNGKISVIIQNGRVLKSGYEEGYFRHHPEI